MSKSENDNSNEKSRLLVLGQNSNNHSSTTGIGTVAPSPLSPFTRTNNMMADTSDNSSVRHLKTNDSIDNTVVDTAAAGDDLDMSEHYYRNSDQAGSLSHLQSLFSSTSSTRNSDTDTSAAAAAAATNTNTNSTDSATVTAIDDGLRSSNSKNNSSSSSTGTGNHPLQRKSTQKRSNKSFHKNNDDEETATESTERTSLLMHNKDGFYVTQDSPVSFRRSSANKMMDLFQSPSSSSLEKTPKVGTTGRKLMTTTESPSPPITTTISSIFNNHNNYNNNNYHNPDHAAQSKDQDGTAFNNNNNNNKTTFWSEVKIELQSPSTYIGAFMFVLYHVVFCLAAGSAILRPHAKNSLLGLMTKMGALGVMFSSFVYLYSIGNDIPSMYPTCDLFLAPLLAGIAISIDEDLHNNAALLDLTDDENDQVFLATFGVLAFVGMALAGCLLILAGVFKLANLGAYLPFPVLCGFFTAVGIMTWHLGFEVDTSGKTFHMVFFSGDKSLIMWALMHHIPGVIVAVIMKYLGPKNPFYVVVVLFATIAIVYTVMFATGTSLEEARNEGWFWHYEDIVYQHNTSDGVFGKWLPPAPFGTLGGVFSRKVYWPSVVNNLQSVCAMSFLYLIRCALHSAALLKNLPSLQRHVRVTAAPEVEQSALRMPAAQPRKKTRMEKFSEIVDIEEIMSNVTDTKTHTDSMVVEHAKPTSMTLKGLIVQYGLAQMVSCLVGSFGIVPSVATSHAMFGLKAEKIAPQIGSVLLLSIFYFTDFRLIAFVPKLAFSCLLSLAFIDIILTWLIRSYLKTKEKMEWLVVPVIVVFAFGIGLLQAVLLGIAISTFLFVAAFFRSGVVKFAATGLTVRSTIERPVSSAHWLDTNGDQIQIVILQNYLFFGNASSILEYIASMFENHEMEEDELPPLPKFVILDMALVTGIDTSTVDIISDILNLCKKHDCKLFLSGMSPSLRSVLSHAGVKPLVGERSERNLRFFSSLDIALGKAEDMLLNFQVTPKKQSMYEMPALGEESGFKLALRKVDEQHGTDFAHSLAELDEYTTPIVLEPNESLYDSASLPERGLFFIEEGILKIERDTSMATHTRSLRKGVINDGGTVTGLKIRTGSIGREYARLKAADSASHKQSFRLARIGPGWVVGAVEAVSGLENTGLHLAVTACRLHYLSYSQMESLEGEDPVLMLRLYKLLSSMMAKQQEVTIGQLGTLHAIMASPAQLKPVGRKASMMFQDMT